MPNILLNSHFVIINELILLQFFFSVPSYYCLRLSLLRPNRPSYNYDLSLSYILSSLFVNLVFTLPGLLCHHLPCSHMGNQGLVLSWKLLSSYLSLFSILFVNLIALSSNFMTPIYDFKFYDSDLCLQYPSLRPLPLGPRLYFSSLIGHHKVDGNRHLKINMASNKHMLYPVTLPPVKTIHSSPVIPESENAHISHFVTKSKIRLTRDSFLLLTSTLS